MISRLIKIILPLVILAAAFGIYKYQISNKPVPVKAERVKKLPKVRVAKAEAAQATAKAEGFGTVAAAKTLNIVTEVSGRVISVSQKMRSGGEFKKGEVMFSIETVSYEAALASAKANLRSAELSLAKVEQEADVSLSEWEIWNKGVSSPAQPSPLIAYGPQLVSAKAAVEYAEKTVKKAENDLMKTEYKAPFDCIVVSESIEVSMAVTAGQTCGQIVGSREYEVVVPVLAAAQSEISASAEIAKASKAVVILHEGANSWQWMGYVSRVLPDADAKTAMIKLVVAVPEPNAKQSKRPPLTIGSNVECRIEGDIINGLISLPKEALRDGSTVWVADKGVLKIKPVKTAAFGEKEVYVSEGISAGEKVIVSRLNGAVDGMGIEIAGDSK